MKNFTQKEIKEIITILKKTYPDAKPSLNFNSPFELLVAVILSAQCTDKRVNEVCHVLFEKYNTSYAIDSISQEELESYINSCGLYKQKAKSIKQSAKILCEKYDGNVPSSMEELMSLPGIGRKSANVIRNDAFNLATGIAVDTHVKRISNKIGFSDKTDPNKIEQDLISIIPQENLKDMNHLLIYHGRAICKSRKPLCENCPISSYCEYFMQKD